MQSEVKSSGYVIHTLEAAVWCLLTTSSFQEAVIQAVRLGEDTDITAAVTGGLAGILYGFKNIPHRWVEKLARSEDIKRLSEQLDSRYAFSS